MTLLALMGLVSGLGLIATWLVAHAAPRLAVHRPRRHPHHHPKRDLP